MANLDVEYYVDELEPDCGRYRAAAEWIATNVARRTMQVSVSIVDDETIREVNREQMQHDWATDVVSSVIESTDALADGEVIASWDTAQRLSEAAGWNPRDELLLYVVHGMLHVAGLNDIEDTDRLRMRQTEIECLLAIGVSQASQLPEKWNDVSY